MLKSKESSLKFLILIYYLIFKKIPEEYLKFVDAFKNILF